jgi:hypothetical protein
MQLYGNKISTHRFHYIWSQIFELVILTLPGGNSDLNTVQSVQCSVQGIHMPAHHITKRHHMEIYLRPFAEIQRVLKEGWCNQRKE